MLKLPYKFFIFTHLMVGSFQLVAQQDITEYKQKLQLEEALYPPEDILSTSSLVLYSVSKDVATNEWKNKLTELQGFFSSQGIDAVAYMNAATLYNRPGEAGGLPEVLKRRQIKNVILFHYQGEEKTLFLAIGELTDQINYWTPGDVFWMRTNLSLEPIFQELDTYFRTGASVRTNLLVNDHPEFFEAQADNDRILLTAPPRIRPGYKVALKNWDPDFYMRFGSHFFMDAYLKQSQQYINTWEDRYSLVEKVAMDSANIISFVDPKISITELRRLGYDYELEVFFGNYQQLSSFFKTEEPLQKFEGDRVVFYLKSLGVNTMYLPKDWRPELSWDLALSKLLDAFKSSLFPQKQE